MKRTGSAATVRLVSGHNDGDSVHQRDLLVFDGEVHRLLHLQLNLLESFFAPTEIHLVEIVLPATLFDFVHEHSQVSFDLFEMLPSLFHDDLTTFVGGLLNESDRVSLPLVDLSHVHVVVMAMQLLVEIVLEEIAGELDVIELSGQFAAVRCQMVVAEGLRTAATRGDRSFFVTTGTLHLARLGAH